VSVGVNVDLDATLARGDFEVKHRDLANLDMYVLGARFLLDVI
jgi:hypothetical protein